MKTVVTHSGSFQADEAFSIAILKLIDPKIKVIRSRDEEVLKQADMRVDVGLKYNPETGDYDHHQKEGAGVRENDIPYSSAGLIWKHFGMQLVDTEDEWRIIDDKIMQFIDADDNGIKTYQADQISPYTIPKLVKTFNPSWDEVNPDYDKSFFEVVDILMNLLKREIRKAKSSVKGKEIILKAIKDSGEDIIILEKYCPWKKAAIESSWAKFIVYPSNSGGWNVQCIPKEQSGFEVRKLMPQEWGGLESKEFEQVTKINDLIFCHRGCWIAGAKTKEAALALAKKALES